MYKKILIPVVFDSDHDTAASFAVARALAADNAEFIVMHVQEAIPSYVASEIPAGVTEQARKDLESGLNDLTKDMPNARGILVHGNAGNAITQQAKTEGADCIIIASHRPGLEDYFLGSTASRVVRHAACAVHVIR